MKRLYNLVNRDILKKELAADGLERVTLSFYRYIKILDAQNFRDQMYLKLNEIGVLGRIYVAQEGVNGQLSIPKAKVDELRTVLSTFGLDNLRLNIAIEDDGKSFYKLKIKVRAKIVADGLNDDSFDVTNGGQHLDAESFNKITDQANTVVVDMRNHYESEVGHFENAICPDVTTFRESLPIIEDLLEEEKDKNLVMYCTGGIRCEKASAYFKHKGFKNVYQLDGGIIEYARQVNEKGLDNKFKGKNFVFDERMGERISEDVIAHCHQCGEPADDHINCANDACHILFIQCSNCREKFDSCCTQKCADFLKLPEEEQLEKRKTEIFQGSKFAKGRYKSYRPQ